MENASLIFYLVIILFSMIIARRYNFILGFLTYIGIPTLLCLINLIGLNNDKYVIFISYSLIYAVTPIIELFKVCKLDDLIKNDYLFCGIILGVWLIWTILSIMFRRSRKKD